MVESDSSAKTSCSLDEVGVAVELPTVLQTPGPGEDAGNGVGASGITLHWWRKEVFSDYLPSSYNRYTCCKCLMRWRQRIVIG